MKLILPKDIEMQVDEIMAPLLNPDLWKQMNLSFCKSPYAIVRIEGQPGIGKTALATHMAARLRQKPLHVSFDKVASPHLGETESRINAIFADAHTTETKTIIMEECDALLYSRDFIATDNTHQLGFVNTLLMNIDAFRQRPVPSLLILTSNHPDKLDSALESRVTDVIRLQPPIDPFAEKLWRSKLPTSLKPNPSELEFLTTGTCRTPREIENEVLRACRRAVSQGRFPTMKDFKS